MGISTRIALSFVFLSLFFSNAYGFDVCIGSTSPTTPAISGTTVVWEDFRTGATHPNIYCRYLNQPGDFAVCLSGNPQEFPKIDGSIVVWAESGNIIGYDLANSARLEICTDASTQETPAISGDLVVWAENGDIYGKYLDSGAKFAICTASGTQSEPDIDGNVVVWRDTRNGNDDIYAKNLLNPSTDIDVCVNTYSQVKPKISGQLVVWQDERNSATAQRTDIYGRYLNQSGDFPVCNATERQYSPEVSGNVVVWKDKRTTVYNIYYTDLSKDWSGTEYTGHAITNGSSIMTNPAISNYTVVWENTTTLNIDGAFISYLTSISVNAPAVNQIVWTGKPFNIQWQSQPGLDGVVNLEISKDGGQTFASIATNILNTGSYEWTPAENMISSQCLIRISAAANSTINGVSGAFKIAKCNNKLTADITGDCTVDMADFSAFSAQWLECGNPYDSTCME